LGRRVIPPRDLKHVRPSVFYPCRSPSSRSTQSHSITNPTTGLKNNDPKQNQNPTKTDGGQDVVRFTTADFKKWSPGKVVYTFDPALYGVLTMGVKSIDRRPDTGEYLMMMAQVNKTIDGKPLIGCGCHPL